MATKPNIIKGDAVMIRRGKERGKRGTVKAVDAHSRTATVEGINIVKRHTKSGSKPGNTGGSMQTGGIIEKESPLPLSALAVHLREVQGADATSSRAHLGRCGASHLRALRRAGA